MIGILNNFPQKFWMNNSIEYFGLYWMNIFWMNISDFVLNWIIFRPDSLKKWIFKTDCPGLLWKSTSAVGRFLICNGEYVWSAIDCKLCIVNTIQQSTMLLLSVRHEYLRTSVTLAIARTTIMRDMHICLELNHF